MYKNKCFTLLSTSSFNSDINNSTKAKLKLSKQYLEKFQFKHLYIPIYIRGRSTRFNIEFFIV